MQTQPLGSKVPIFSIMAIDFLDSNERSQRHNSVQAIPFKANLCGHQLPSLYTIPELLTIIKMMMLSPESGEWLHGTPKLN